MKSDYVVTYPVKGIRPLCLSAQEKKFINTKKKQKANTENPASETQSGYEVVEYWRET